MFIAGVVAGPIAGLLVGDYLMRSKHRAKQWTFVAPFLLLLVLVLLPVLPVELRAALLIGYPLGLLLAVTPATRSSADGPSTS